MKCRCIVPHAYEIRIPRTWWMRLLPFSAAYYCTHCQAKSLQFGRHPARNAGAASNPPLPDDRAP